MSKYKIGLGDMTGKPYLIKIAENKDREWCWSIRLFNHSIDKGMGEISIFTQIKPNSIHSFDPSDIPKAAINSETIPFFREALLEAIKE